MRYSRAGERVGAYQFDGLWFDIGRQDDYEQAVATWLSNGNAADPIRYYGAASGDHSSNFAVD